MGFNVGDIFKEHKKIILGMAGIVVMVIILSIIVGQGGGFFSLSNDLTNGGVDNLIDNSDDSDKSYTSEPNMEIDTTKNYYAVLNTDYGQIDIDLYESDTPKTVNNFVFLANKNFYDNLTFHRIVKDFVIQGGDPVGTGEGGPGYTFADEIDADALGLNTAKVGETVYLRYFYSSEDINKNAKKSVKQFYEMIGYKYTSGKGTHAFEPYVIAMANSGPNTNGSQFFITTKLFTGEFLNGKHTVFGKVVSGFDVIDKIESVNVGLNDKPTAAVRIKDVQIVVK